MSTSSNNRKRSRWGDRSSGEQQQSSSSVSDQQALEALLASSKAKQEQKQQEQAPRRDNNRSFDNKRPRRDDGPPKEKKNGPDYSYYGRGGDGENSRGGGNGPGSFGRPEEEKEEEPVDKEKPNFGLSGALAQEQVGDLKFREPPEARAPNTQWRLYVFKDDKALETLHISKQSAYLFGRNPELADIPVLHPSASGQHAVLQYRALPGKEDGRLRCKPYLMDLESTNGSFVNGVKLDPARYYELRKGDVLKFGASTREYVLLTENSTTIK